MLSSKGNCRNILEADYTCLTGKLKDQLPATKTTAKRCLMIQTFSSAFFRCCQKSSTCRNSRCSPKALEMQGITKCSTTKTQPWKMVCRTWACVDFPCPHEEQDWFPGCLHSNSRSITCLHRSQDSQRPKVELLGA